VRLLIAIILIVYCVGVGVELAPTFQSGWAHVPASELTSNIFQALPDALGWPAKVYHNFANRDGVTT